MLNLIEEEVNFERKVRYGYEDLLEIIRLLRSEDGCPWDKVQTHQSIRRNFLEEVYECCEAIDTDDPALSELYETLTEACRSHCRQLRMLLEQSCP